MPVPIDRARALLRRLQAPQVTNLFAQAHAKSVLQEVREAPANFPRFTPDLDDRATFAAYAVLAAGCSLIERGERAEGAVEVERAASRLQSVHGVHAAASRESGFHALIASMAFYAAGL